MENHRPIVPTRRVKKNYWVVRNAGFTRSINTLKLTLFFLLCGITKFKVDFHKNTYHIILSFSYFFVFF